MCRASPTSPARSSPTLTRFRIGSITKPIVAALVLDSVDRGELSLDDIVSRSACPASFDREPPTTVRMLLDHTSGIFNVGDEGDIVADIDKLPDPVMRAEATELGSRYLSGERVIVNDGCSSLSPTPMTRTSRPAPDTTTAM